ncbi:hypoxanthine phosphoribosyltransferase [Schleiferilactobacillus harbinensis]|jgi:hypoxanthine phosphoribosyltransferase|uniref:Hypoxanthine phosphoribosyltransferase n=1 Tax=Schleiferilactobacillus harbinensis TaxID=304207 RepID=A0A5P8Q3T2_9LACO|nr:hypoxanthine phosphoribosyltransferase [Schleiferilactobacillus harbinensis]MCT2908354.1 hypoxanthine phosphoribosyltransferase [Schleiferilactobacillus harbinensis]QEU45853.1 hypoxanthine phosphoribosyltransferase [Schleiferilactobacillus harbinensis]QFR22653.1 hypoxanthine phosphoribosyltransferase [Schleiferilactobacillus harbinensis]QFR64192.1 hypoxanthine phosphoribosyltransferase [Schleiferilactobacillus harbinensis]
MEDRVLQEDIEKVLYSQDEIQATVARLGKELTADYQGKNPLFICILKGAIVFMTDLIRHVDDYVEIDFMDVSSYGNATVSSGEVKILKDLDTSVQGRDVVIVEDIVDTGATLHYLIKLLSTRQAKSIKVVALMDKVAGRKLPVKADYVGFDVPNEFVVGYGLDYAERYRNLPYIGVLAPHVYE